MKRLPKTILVVFCVVVLNSCHHVPLERPVRETPSLPVAIAGRLRPPQPGSDLRLELLATEDHYRHYTLKFETPGSEFSDGCTVTGEYYEPLDASPERPVPLLQVSPILGGAESGYSASRTFAVWATQSRLAAFFLYQEESIMALDFDGGDLERRLISTTHENLQAIELMIERPEIDADRLASLGISMGAIKNVLLVAAEPRLTANVLCLVGGNFPEIIRDSREPLVLEYIRARARVGVSKEGVVDDLSKQLVSDPLDVAPYVDPRRVLLFLASIDDKVPYRNGIALHRALGRPELHVLPVGHYTSLVFAPHVAEASFDWIVARFSDEDRGSGVDEVAKPRFES